VPSTRIGQLEFLEARHPAYARVEDRLRHAKDSRLGRFPSREFKINQAWLMLVGIAADLVAWARLLACATWSLRRHYSVLLSTSSQYR